MSKEYFPHDYGARLSLRGVRKDFGLEGVGVYWCIVEILHEEGGYIKENDIDNIAFDLQAKPEMCQAIINNYDLFVNKKGKIYSERVLKNIKKREEITIARKKAAEERWKTRSSDTPENETPQPCLPTNRDDKGSEESDTDDKFAEKVQWFRDILKQKCQEIADSYNNAFELLGDPCFSLEEYLNNVIDEIANKRTLTINHRNIDTIDFLQQLVYFFKDKETMNDLYNVIMEVQEKAKKGEVKNKQNYLISTIWNQGKMTFNG